MKQEISLSVPAAGRKNRIKMPLFLVKIARYEYWPFWVLFSPALFYWFYLALRARSFTYFTAANPGIELGGFFGESKINILRKIAAEYLPATLFFETRTTTGEIRTEMKKNGMGFPVICKPDKGEMGFRVAKISSEAELADYLEDADEGLIVQEFVTYETELGILYYRFPDGSRSGITSVVRKEFLAVTGDGMSTVAELINESSRARFQLAALNKKLGGKMETVLPAGERLLLEPIGNHCRGTKFLDGSGMIDERLIAVFDRIASGMEGFYFGRFDLKVSSVEDLYAGRNIRIMEVNGTTSEPAHIYDPRMNLPKAYRAIFHNMKLVYCIARQNRAGGVSYTPVMPGKFFFCCFCRQHAACRFCVLRIL
ncbi:MAG: hypothetical protein FD123_3718 [Bacteroidetes bacterium]|nr:MAG: hypothetical protein FD123_3718 [Bacteroidota bacterium]